MLTTKGKNHSSSVSTSTTTKTVPNSPAVKSFLAAHGMIRANDNGDNADNGDNGEEPQQRQVSPDVPSNTVAAAVTTEAAAEAASISQQSLHDEDIENFLQQLQNPAPHVPNASMMMSMDNDDTFKNNTAKTKQQHQQKQQKKKNNKTNNGKRGKELPTLINNKNNEDTALWIALQNDADLLGRVLVWMTQRSQPQITVTPGTTATGNNTTITTTTTDDYLPTLPTYDTTATPSTEEYPMVIPVHFVWRNYPLLQQVLLQNMDQYYHWSKSKERKKDAMIFNDQLTKLVRETAFNHGYSFCAELQTHKALRDRIRCFYKTHVQNSKKRLDTMMRSKNRKSLLREYVRAALQDDANGLLQRCNCNSKTDSSNSVHLSNDHLLLPMQDQMRLPVTTNEMEMVTTNDMEIAITNGADVAMTGTETTANELPADDPHDNVSIERSAAANATVDDPSVSKPRRSGRDTNRLRLWDKTSLSYRRLEELFFSNKNIPRTIGHYTLSLIHDSPNIYTIDNFLNQKDLAFLQRAATTRTFEPSFVDDPSTNQSFAQDDHRTSTFVSFQKQENAHVASLEHRAASLLGCFTTRSVEALQLVRYEAGQFFGVHHDLGDYNDATVALPPKQLFCSRRLVTIFVYVNDVESGGETWFPRANVKVVPRAGRAVVWQNVLANGEPDVRTIHAGLVVNKGVKYGLNMWLTEA